MKYKIPLLALSFLITFTQHVYAQATGVQPVLNKYLIVKDALINGVVTEVSKAAVELLASIENVEESNLKPKEKKLFEKGKTDLLKYTKSLSTSSDIEKQRTFFAGLSIALWELVKDAESIDQHIYYQYCPMKKRYWLSSEIEIQNPYYGFSMLNCGNVADKKLN